MRPLILLLALSLFSSALIATPTTIQYWDTVRRGANFFNRVETEERFANARKERIEIVRLVFNKWVSKNPLVKDGDFLIGNFDHFEKLIEADVLELTRILDLAQKHQIKIVLSTLSLPGAKWKQQNGNKLDSRLWTEQKFHEMSAEVWKQIAFRFKHHPAIAAYNILNEPYPEAAPPAFKDWYTGNYGDWYKLVEDKAGDLNKFNKTVLAAIREVDTTVPVIFDSGFYSTPYAFKIVKPLADKSVLYAFHMYEPYAYTSYQNKTPYTYPGPVPIGEGDKPPLLDWDAESLKDFHRPVTNWQAEHNVASNRIFAGEFGTYRRKNGSDHYLNDLIATFETNRWHWAFYSYQEDTWEGMDYELGKFILPPEYWEAEAKGINSRKKYYNPNSLMDVLKKALRKNSSLQKHP